MGWTEQSAGFLILLIDSFQHSVHKSTTCPRLRQTQRPRGAPVHSVPSPLPPPPVSVRGILIELSFFVTCAACLELLERRCHGDGRGSLSLLLSLSLSRSERCRDSLDEAASGLHCFHSEGSALSSRLAQRRLRLARHGPLVVLSPRVQRGAVAEIYRHII